MDHDPPTSTLSLKFAAGAGACCLVAAGSAWTGNPYIAAGGLVLALAASLACGRSLAAPLAALRAGLTRMQARRRDFLFDEVKSWAAFGELGRMVSDCVVFNMERREFYRGAVQAVGSPFFLCDAKSVITHASDSLMGLLGKKAADVVGQTVSQAFYNRQGQAVTDEVLRTAKGFTADRQVTLWDGRTLDLFLYIDCIRSGSGQVLGAVGCLVDVTLAKKHERAMASQQAQLIALGGSIAEVAQRVASATEELSASAEEQARGAQRQKSQTESVVTAMEEMTATVMEVSKNAGESAQAAEAASASAQEGAGLVKQAVVGIAEVAESSRKLAGVIAQLDAQSSEIDRIIGVISDIADQTNLLALNAAIEAARAGEAGRGFAVVADEVRKLAEKTMVATKEVENSIREIQERSRHAMANMKETERQVAGSTDLSNRTGLALTDILGRIEDVNARVTQIATAAEQQSSAAEEINRSIEDIAAVARETEEGVTQAASATRELAELSQSLLHTAKDLAEHKGG